jgi:hypothetical protein
MAFCGLLKGAVLKGFELNLQTLPQMCPMKHLEDDVLHLSRLVLWM